MNKKEYLQNKGLLPPDLGVLYIVKSTTSGVTLTEETIWGVESFDNRKVYSLKEPPYGISIDNDKKHGELHGYGTGFGDLWSWSYFATLNKTLAEEYREKELNRVTLKYLSPKNSLNDEDNICCW